MILGEKIRLRAKRLSDAHNDYQWQTDPELARLDATPLLTISFSKYLADYTKALRQPPANRHTFAIETFDGKQIGNCVYYNVDRTKGEAEVGIMIGHRQYWGKGYGTDAVTTLVNYIFRETNLKRLYLKTLEWNQSAQKCFRKCGFMPCGHMLKDGYNFVLMGLHRQEWTERQAAQVGTGQADRVAR